MDFAKQKLWASVFYVLVSACHDPLCIAMYTYVCYVCLAWFINTHSKYPLANPLLDVLHSHLNQVFSTFGQILYVLRMFNILQFHYSYKIVSNSCWQSWGGDTSTSTPLTPKPPNPLRTTSRRQTPPLPPSPSVAWSPSSCVNSSFLYLLQVRSWMINLGKPILFSADDLGEIQTRPKSSTKTCFWQNWLPSRSTPVWTTP